jgi:D-sedoheptulose 7-phosphate isomerase
MQSEALRPHRLESEIAQQVRESISVNLDLARDTSLDIAEAATLILTRLQSGGKLIAFGNGGSAADAQHLAAEFVGRYQADRMALAAIALTTDSSGLTAIGNDYGFEYVFARQLEAIGKPDDVALAISTSGDSPNVLQAIESAKKCGISTIGLTGRTGGRMRRRVDLCLCVPSDSTPRIQEAHTLIVHILTGIVEKAFVSAAASSDQVHSAIQQT